MNSLQNLLPAKIFDVIERAGISTFRQLMILSVWDIKKLTNLCTDDILFVKRLVSDHISPEAITCDKLLQLKIKTGCEVIDDVLKGGFKVGTITELYGESGSGKTQLGIQVAAHNETFGCVYICTEDIFPIKRFRQIKKNIDYNSDEYSGSNIFIEHLTESNDLISCIRVRLPKLLEKKQISLIIIDSVAAPFRSDNTNYVQRAEELRELALALKSIAQEFNLAILCVNQVTTCFDGTVDVLPSLGLAWSNMVPTRLWLKKTNRSCTNKFLNVNTEINDEHNLFIRELSVIFSPDLPNSKVDFVITSNGIQGL